MVKLVMGILQISTGLLVPHCESQNIALPSHINLISSPNNPFVKHCVKLRQSSPYRHSSGSALVVGITPVREISRFQELKEEGPAIMDCLILLDGAKVPKGLLNFFARVVHVSPIVMKKLAGVESVDSIEAIALMKIPHSFNNINNHQGEANLGGLFPYPHRILALDRIQDPGNLGTLLRTAMAFRWDGVFLLPGCCDPFNDKALRAARGASFQLPIVSGNWCHLENLKNNFHMKMLAGHPENNEGKTPILLSQELASSFEDEHLCLVLGSEGQGLSNKAKEGCELLSIPMAGKFESLNVSVAGGIFLFLLQPQNRRVI